jgi:hypothetical protein
MIFKHKNKPVPVEPTLPEGWRIEVRPQQSARGEYWDYRIVPPLSIRSYSNIQEHRGSYYVSRAEAVREGTREAQTIQRNFDNKVTPWEKV